ncbi:MULTISPECIES: hypothetical protein [unclassified Curtobacterium]|uniref:hypothetical protein n=1 Tax=unclassified Curtobacterium TaxID=257496 RepID=UPI00111410BE|nr:MULTISPECIES: hypothetical protein [unclassified Curtobacterium]
MTSFLNVLVDVDVDANGIVATFDLGDAFPAEPVANRFTYGIALVDESGALVKHFAVRFSPTQTAAFIFDFASATQANYDASHVDDAGTSVVVRFPDSSLGTDAVKSVTGIGTVNGENVSADIPVQLLQ